MSEQLSQTCRGGGYVFAKEVVFLVAFECLSVCNRDSWKAFE